MPESAIIKLHYEIFIMLHYEILIRIIKLLINKMRHTQ